MRFALFLVLAASCNSPEPLHDSESAEDRMPERAIEEVLRDHSERLMEIDGVVSVGIGLCHETSCIRVGVLELTDELRDKLPERLEGHPVDIVETGPVRPRDG